MSAGTGTTLGGKDLHTLRGTLDPIPVGVILFDPHGRPLVANRAARDLLGDVATMPVAHWAESGRFRLPGGEKAGPLDLPPCLTIRDAGAREEIELGFEGEDDVLVPLLVSSRAVQDTEGDVVQVACSLTPIAEHRKRGQQECLENRFDAIGSLLAGVAGPINDALTAITGYCDIACDGLEDFHPVKGVVEEIRQAGRRAAVLTGRLMSHAQREVAVPRPVDLDGWLATHVTTLGAVLGDGIDLDVRPGADGASVRADETLLQQMLVDLLTNAREAMPEGGSVVVSTSPVKVDPIIAQLMGEPEGAAYVALTVRDSGKGMAESVLRRIFEPFYSTKPGALGLGLSTVDRLARVQGGSVRVENHRGDGASFHVHLPRVAPLPQEQAAAAASGGNGRPAHTLDATVLLVEDDVVVRDLVCQVLELQGCHVLEARSSADANRVLETWTGADPDLLVSDVVLPGERGPEVAARMRKRFPDLKVLLMSGCNDPALLGPTLADAETAFLPKPFSPESLLNRVRALLPKTVVEEPQADEDDIEDIEEYVPRADAPASPKADAVAPVTPRPSA